MEIIEADKYGQIEIKMICPCGKEMIATGETTSGRKCPDEDCWVVPYKGKIWIRKRVK
jgi:hypothetical protein